LIEQRNKADGLVYSTERMLEEFAESIPESDNKELETALDAVRRAMEGEDCGALRAAVDELSALTYKMTEHLYAELGGEDAE
jgi:molecular chaperone DnaK